MNIKVASIRTESKSLIAELIMNNENRGWKLDKFTTSNGTIHTFIFRRRFVLFWKLMDFIYQK